MSIEKEMINKEEIYLIEFFIFKKYRCFRLRIILIIFVFLKLLMMF